MIAFVCVHGEAVSSSMEAPVSFFIPPFLPVFSFPTGGQLLASDSTAAIVVPIYGVPVELRVAAANQDLVCSFFEVAICSGHIMVLAFCFYLPFAVFFAHHRYIEIATERLLDVQHMITFFSHSMILNEWKS